MTRGNLDAAQTLANEQTGDVCAAWPSVCMGNGSHSLSGCMCYFCWASHIEQTNNLFQLKRAAELASVCRKGSVLQWITSALKTVADCVLRGGGSRSAIVWRIGDAMERATGWLKQNKRTTKKHKQESSWGGSSSSEEVEAAAACGASRQINYGGWD